MGSDPDASIAGCTALIRAGEEIEFNLANVYYNRAIAYIGKGDFDRAILDFDHAG